MSATATTPERPSQNVPADDLEQPSAEPPGNEQPGESPDITQGLTNCSLSPEEEAELARIKDLPKEVGVMLLTVGVLGFVLPGVVGTPVAIAGGLVLWPKAFGKVENWFERRFPKMHKQSLYQINRYLNDLENRYPDATHRD
jgi:hypothetical protein